ncbi:LuxR C-terminal-related transcriptional regulator [Streptomyces sp. NPDC006012]|uniref:helix-turn-helix transcriptional regulator n=1 Tax=Streptomyces sp. NPDC006012 TaxID=3364739 RepID=UPI0036A706D9
MLDLGRRLPGRQRDAVGVALGLTTGPVPDRFVLGLAVLGLLSEASTQRPPLCLIDDAQWVDAASLQVLAFVARRLQAEPVAVLFATRGGEAVLDGLPELEVRGLRDEDAEALEQLTAAGGTSDWALGLTARCRALLTADHQAEDLYREAIDRLGRTRLRPDLARAHLQYGEWLRRQRRQADARGQLQCALDLFTQIGMAGFAQRTRTELAATGVRTRRPGPGAQGDLTAQELRICRLVTQGETNNEIATRLFISLRTVQYHLHKAFHKLGVTSHTQLARRLTEDEDKGFPSPTGS